MQTERNEKVPKRSMQGLQKYAGRWRTLKRPILLAFASIQLSAALPPTGLEHVGRKLDDSELADMRGKFVAPQGISYFGIAMQTAWETGDGITTVATLLFNLSFAADQLGGGTPHLLVGWTRGCEDCGDPAMDVATPNGVNPVIPEGLDSVQGVVQSQIVNGTDNSVHNAMSIAVVPIDQVDQLNTAGLTQVSSSTSQVFGDGDTIQFIMKPGEIALALSEADGDLVRQSVGSELNQAAQHVLLNSDFNSISNTMNITVGINELQQSDQLRVQNALSAMKGRGF